MRSVPADARAGSVLRDKNKETLQGGVSFLYGERDRRGNVKKSERDGKNFHFYNFHEIHTQAGRNGGNGRGA